MIKEKLCLISVIILFTAVAAHAEPAARSGLSVITGWSGLPSFAKSGLKSTDTTLNLEGYTLGLSYVSYGSKGPKGVFSSRYTFTYDHYHALPQTKDFTARNADIFMLDVAEILTIFPSWPVNLYTGIGMGWGIMRLYNWSIPTDPSVDPQKVKDLENKIGKYPLPFPTIYIPVGLNIRISNFIFSAETGIRDIPYLIGMLTYTFNKEDNVKIVKEVVQLPPPPSDTGKVTGKIIDLNTNEPIGRAIIEMRNTDRTDLSTNPVFGTFTTPELKAGIVDLYASKEGYLPGSITATVQAGRTVSATIALQKEPATGAAFGTVTNLQGNPLSATISAAAVSAQGMTVQASWQVTSNPLTGEFFMKLQAGTYSISASSPGYKTQAVTILVNKGFKTGVNFKMEPEQIAPAITLPPPAPPAFGKKPKVFIEKKKIIITEKIFFTLGKAKILSVSFNILDELSALLMKNPDIKIRIEGYTDSTGRPETNLRLSQKRAEAVRDYLIKKGITPERMTAKGYGMTMPIADNKTAAGRAENRRVEFSITSR